MAVWRRAEGAEGAIGRWAGCSLLAVGALWLVAYWLRFPHNYTVSDPWQYALHAHLVATGSYFKAVPSPNIFGQRFGTFVPVALVYTLFGMSPQTTALVPLMAGRLFLVSVWLRLPRAAALARVI